MAVNLVIRLIGSLALGAAGFAISLGVSGDSSERVDFMPWGLALTLGGLLLGGVIAPYVVRLIGALNRVPAATLISSTIGLVSGLIVAALVSIPLFSLDSWFSWGFPLIISLALGFLGFWLGVQRQAEVQNILPGDGGETSGSGARSDRILVDTSAIIDGRIGDLGQTGFLQGTLIIPEFVLDELRHIADSSDPMRRSRGRRGLEVLAKLRKEPHVRMKVLEVDLRNGAEVDGQLVKLAKAMKALILTTDFNLNRVAEVQGVKVLNVNELSNALKPMVLPGDELNVNIVQEGKEVGQGVAYLDDGTMIVVEGGKRYLNSFQEVVVTRVLQTSAGRIIFSQPKAE